MFTITLTRGDRTPGQDQARRRVEEVAAEQQQWTRPLAKLLLDIKAAVGQAKGRARRS